MDSVASFSILGGGGGDAGCPGAGFCCLLCLEIMMYDNIFNSIKNKRTLK